VQKLKIFPDQRNDSERNKIATQRGAMPGRYITDIITVVLSDPLPDAAVTTMEYVPAGVPVDGLSC